MIKEYFEYLYLKHISRPKPKFKIGDILEVNNDGIKLGIKINKQLKVSHVYWILGGYVILFENCKIHESLNENWLKLKE